MERANGKTGNTKNNYWTDQKHKQKDDPIMKTG